MTGQAQESGVCAAPGCGAATTSRYHHLCDACVARVQTAMLRAKPSLMEMMVEERQEAERWLASDWAPARRWVIADNEYYPEPLDTVVDRMTRETSSEWGGPYLGFVDDMLDAKQAKWQQKYDAMSESHKITAWLVPSDSESAAVWRAHLAPLVRAAVEQALATFPLTWAGREIKASLTGTGGYDEGSSGLEELWEGTGPTGLSDAAENYLELRHPPHPTWMCEAIEWPDGLGASLWRRYRVLSDDIMAILDAVDARCGGEERGEPWESRSR